MTPLWRPALLLIGLSYLAAVAVGCSGDGEGGTGPQGIQRADVVGSYRATIFRSTVDGTTTDQLAAGAEFTIVLAGDGSTTGRLFIPGGAEDGSDLDADMAGTWSFDDASDQVRFQQAVDTFVRDMIFTAVRSGTTMQLRGDQSFGNFRIEVVLSRQGAP